MMTEDMTGTPGGEGHADEQDKNFDYDGFWKSLILRFYYYLLKRAVPELYEKVDTTREPRSMDKEFLDLVNTGKRRLHKSPHFADLVLAIPMKDGSGKYLLFHCEAQGRGSDIAERMNFYRCLIYAHYREEPVALVIITDGHRKDERLYSHSFFGTEITYKYNNLVLAELDDRELQASDNPIDLALYAAKCALRAKDEPQKFDYLRSLLDLLGKRGWNREDKRDLLLFLERIMDLQDKKLEKKYVEHREQLVKEDKIMYIPLGERELAQEIRQRGRQEGMEEMVKNLLAEGVAPDVIARSARWTMERVRTLLK